MKPFLCMNLADVVTSFRWEGRNKRQARTWRYRYSKEREQERVKFAMDEGSRTRHRPG